MQSRLADSGGLFSFDSKTGETNFTLERINENIEAIGRYDKAMQALKEKGATDELMARITSMSVEEGTKLAQSLESMGQAQFDETMAAWEKQQTAAADVAARFYAGALDTLKTDFAAKVGGAVAEIPQAMADSGAAGAQSWVDGLKAQMEQATPEIRKMFEGLIGRFGGPSGQDADGEDTAGAYAEGILAGAPQVSDAGAKTVDTFTKTAADKLPGVAKSGEAIVGILTKAIGDKQGSVTASAKQTSGTFCGTVRAQQGEFRQSGLYAMQGLEAGLREGGKSAISAAWEIANEIIRAMRFAMDIHSPSRKMAKLVGKPAAEGVGVGFQEGMQRVYAEIRGTMDGEMGKLSAEASIRADREAAQSSPAPIQTIVQRETTEKIPTLNIKGDGAALMRWLYPYWEVETKRRGKSMVKGGAML